MKKLLFALSILFIFLSCESAIQMPPEIIPEDPPVTEDPLPESDIMFGLYNGTDLKFYDGYSFETAYTNENITYAENRILSIDDTLFYMDENGIPTKSYLLTGVPSALLITNPESRSIVYQDDFYHLEDITPEWSAANGGLYKPYTHIKKNNVEVDPWFTHQFEVDYITEAPNGHIVITDKLGSLHNITGPEKPFKIYDGLFIYDLDYTNRRAWISSIDGSQIVYFSENYFYTAKWQQRGDIWISNYGLEYSYSDGITENANALKDFKNPTYPYPINYLPSGEKPSLHPAGQREENSEMVSYWICSTSGVLIKYIDSMDRYELIVELYRGPFNYATGNTEAKYLKPQWIEDKLYFHYGGSIRVYDPVIGSVNIFSDDAEIFVW